MAAARYLDRIAVRRIAFGSLVLVGVVAAAVLSFPSADERQGERLRAAGVSPDAPCEVTDTEPPTVTAGGHPSQDFFHAGDPFWEEDLAHTIGDGFVVVRYRESLSEAERQQLAGWIDGRDLAVIGAPDLKQKEVVRAVAASRTLSCSRFDAGSVQRFTYKWSADQRTSAAG